MAAMTNMLNLTVGLDEVGRGCWAGPLVAAAVVLGEPILGLNDSKKLSRQQRGILDRTIRMKALSFGVGWVEPEEIDLLGMTASVRVAFTRALENISVKYDHIIVDGNINYFAPDPRAQAIIRADATVPAVSAASIIAKVARDCYMIEISHDFPEYGFDQHVGYGTALHIQALQQYGICQLHRRSFKPISRFLTNA